MYTKAYKNNNVIAKIQLLTKNEFHSGFLSVQGSGTERTS